MKPFVLVPGAFADIAEGFSKLFGDRARYPGKTTAGLDTSVRNVEAASIPLFYGEAAKLREDLTYRMRHANAEFGFQVDYLPSLEYLVYGPGGFYSKHSDIGWPEGREMRKISIIIQLSNPTDYEGGELDLDIPADKPQLDQVLYRQRGSLLFFPSYMTHGVRPITSGERRALVGWFHGPAWR